jgi:hypothetical protein
MPERVDGKTNEAARLTMSKTGSQSLSPSVEVLKFLGVDLRLSGLQEFLISHRDTTTQQLLRCARWYKEQAMHELYPARKCLNGLTAEMYRNVLNRAIEASAADSHAGRVVPPVEQAA